MRQVHSLNSPLSGSPQPNSHRPPAPHWQEARQPPAPAAPPPRCRPWSGRSALRLRAPLAPSAAPTRCGPPSRHPWAAGGEDWGSGWLGCAVSAAGGRRGGRAPPPVVVAWHPPRPGHPPVSRAHAWALGGGRRANAGRGEARRSRSRAIAAAGAPTLPPPPNAGHHRAPNPAKTRPGAAEGGGAAVAGGGGCLAIVRPCRRNSPDAPPHPARPQQHSTPAAVAVHRTCSHGQRQSCTPSPPSRPPACALRQPHPTRPPRWRPCPALPPPRAAWPRRSR